MRFITENDEAAEEDLLPIPCQHAMELLGCSRFALWYVDGEQEELCLRTSIGGALLRGTGVPIDKGGLAAAACLSKRPIQVLDCGGEKRYNQISDCGGDVFAKGPKLVSKPVRDLLSIPIFKSDL